MVAQTRQPRQAVSLQAGPGEVDTGTLFDMNLRCDTCPSTCSSTKWDQLDRKQTINNVKEGFLFSHVCHSFRVNNGAARAIGRQLAAIGDTLDREWASRDPNWPPSPLHMLRPAQALTRTIYRYEKVKKTHLSIFSFYMIIC